MFRAVFTAICLQVALIPALADSVVEPPDGRTYSLAAGDASPPASLADAGWLVGNWVGTGFGQRIEEVWNPPSAGSMVGMFKLFGDEISLYELMLLAEENGSLVLKVRHFGADFSAWEDKTDFVRFPLVRLDDDALHFDGLSFYRDTPDMLRVYVRVRHGDAVREEALQYTRRDAPASQNRR